MRQFDPDLLQTLVAFADAGTLARAADIVGRTPSAVTAQVQRLEAMAGVPLLEAAGRRRVLTAAGERLVGHARRILAANREAWLSVSGAEADGRVGLGMTQDFADTDLPAILREFAGTHPRLRIDLRVGRTVELSADLSARRIDVLAAMRGAVEPDEVAVIRQPMRWLSATGGLVGRSGDEIPLAVLDPPCGFRDAALKALDAARLPYRIAATSPSLSGIMAAVLGGVAVSVRTPRSLVNGIAVAPRKMALPRLPDAEFSIRVRADSGDVAQRLAAVLAQRLRLNT
jgi:DNA-binding transcriptional LysR family regulator